MDEVTLKGPLFNGKAMLALEEMVKAIEDDLAKEAVKEVHATLSRVLQHPTGYYESRVQASNTGSGEAVTDGGVIYGPWLEGVGSRNQTTRFKGYHTFEDVSKALSQKAAAKANAIAIKYVAAMN